MILPTTILVIIKQNWSNKRTNMKIILKSFKKSLKYFSLKTCLLMTPNYLNKTIFTVDWVDHDKRNTLRI